MTKFLIFHWDGCISAGHSNAQRYDDTVNDGEYPEILKEDRTFRFSDQVVVSLGSEATFKIWKIWHKNLPISPTAPCDPGTCSTVSDTNLRCNFARSPTVSQKAAPSGGKSSQSNGPFHLGGFGQLGIQNLPHPQPGGNGRGCRHHPAQTTDH